MIIWQILPELFWNGFAGLLCGIFLGLIGYVLRKNLSLSLSIMACTSIAAVLVDADHAFPWLITALGGYAEKISRPWTHSLSFSVLILACFGILSLFMLIMLASSKYAAWCGYIGLAVFVGMNVNFIYDCYTHLMWLWPLSFKQFEINDLDAFRYMFAVTSTAAMLMIIGEIVLRALARSDIEVRESLQAAR